MAGEGAEARLCRRRGLRPWRSICAASIACPFVAPGAESTYEMACHRRGARTAAVAAAPAAMAAPRPGSSCYAVHSNDSLPGMAYGRTSCRPAAGAGSLGCAVLLAAPSRGVPLIAATRLPCVLRRSLRPVFGLTARYATLRKPGGRASLGTPGASPPTELFRRSRPDGLRIAAENSAAPPTRLPPGPGLRLTPAPPLARLRPT